MGKGIRAELSHWSARAFCTLCDWECKTPDFIDYPLPGPSPGVRKQCQKTRGWCRIVALIIALSVSKEASDEIGT